MTEKNQTITYGLTGLHCGACVKRVTQALAPLAYSAEVSLQPMQVVLTGAAVGFDALKSAVEGAGKYVLLPDSVANSALNLTLAQSKRALAAPVNIAAENSTPSWLTTYSPLLLIVAYIFGASLLVQIGTSGFNGMASVTLMVTMRYFMAGFFLVFSFFKLLDINAFADAYSGYDLLAQRWRGWGLIYPFVELGLGVAYLAHVNPLLTHLATIIVMGFSTIGVVRAVLNKTQIQCACLGTVFKLPMSTVTIVEDVGMVLMAAVMLLIV